MENQEAKNEVLIGGSELNAGLGLLRSCPFCGSDGIPIKEGAMSHVHCLACGAQGPQSAMSFNAIRDWNKRA